MLPNKWYLFPEAFSLRLMFSWEEKLINYTAQLLCFTRIKVTILFISEVAIKIEIKEEKIEVESNDL